MSGPLGSDQWMYSTGFYPHEINQSLRFNDDDFAYLSRTPATTGNRKTWTWSGWVKRGNLGSQQDLFGAGASGSADDRIGFLSNDTFYFYSSNGTTIYRVDTNAVFRDVGSWYHIFVSTDTTQATEANRVKVWVNGVQQTLTEQNSGYPVQDYQYVGFNTTNQHIISAWNQLAGYYHLDGYMAEVNFIDGQALDPTSFGELKSGVWVAKEYEGTYGTNGFYLNFGNSGSLGADVSGNSNNWTPTNLASTDQMLDSPTNSFATLNPLAKNGHNLSEGNCRYTASSSTDFTCKGSYGLSSGKWYWEVYAQKVDLSPNNERCQIGITGSSSAFASFLAEGPTDYTYFSSAGTKWNNNSQTAYGASYATGDLIGIALDLDAGTLVFYKNGISQGTAFFGLSGEFSPALGVVVSPESLVANFGQDSSFAGNKTRQGYTDARGIGDFYYAPPAGYLALCTANLPDPVIDPAQDDVPEDYFNTVLWAGDNTSPFSLTGVGFQPDFVWTKVRNASSGHVLFDAVRGTGNYLISDNTNAEVTTNSFGMPTSFDADGWSAEEGTYTGYEFGNFNMSGRTYVGWNWKADGAGVTNTDGSITSTVSANQKAGFSIVTWTGNGNSSGNVGTGLSSSIPIDMAIVKKRSTTSEWQVGHRASGQGVNFAYHLELNGTSALSGSGPYMMGSQATSNAGLLFLASEGLTNGVDYIAYCFTSVDGYSKFGSYTGNASADGPFVYTGFRPAFVLVKSTQSTNQWYIYDTKRDLYNPEQSLLIPNSSGAEFAWQHVDFLSNGFKIKSDNWDWNYPGKIIYMAFAEMPFKYANAR